MLDSSLQRDQLDPYKVTQDLHVLDQSYRGELLHYILNCYLEPGEDEKIKNRAARISEIAADILKQDSQARIVVCGDFNK